MDGDLQPDDPPGPRPARADTVLILDSSPARCARRAVRLSRERAGFWRWLLTRRHRSRPGLLHAVTIHAPTARVHLVRTPHQLSDFLAPSAAQHADPRHRGNNDGHAIRGM